MITVKRFTAPWCAPCRMLAPAFKQMQFDMPEVTFETIDVEIEPEIAQQNKVTSVPTVMIYNDETLVETIVGANSKHKYIESIEKAKTNAN